jgi:hypothetical protein
MQPWVVVKTASQFEFLLWIGKPTSRPGPQIGWRAPKTDIASMMM